MKHIFLYLLLCASTIAMAQPEPIFLETFDRCMDAEDENYGYTGGNDDLWGGDIAKAIAIYQDSPEWNFTYCNGAYQCLKVGTSQKQGSATTPLIACSGDVVVNFRVAPWEGDSIFYVSVSGGMTADPTQFHLKKHQWTDVTIRVSDITDGLRLTFTSTNKHRFFLDDICVRPADPSAGAIRSVEGAMLDWGLVGRHYSATSRTLHIEGANLSDAGITASLKDGETELFQLSRTTLPAEGGELTINFKSGATADIHGCYLYLRGKDKKSDEIVEKRITLMVEVASLDLEGSGTRQDPYTCADVITLAANEGTVWTGTMYWVSGYVLGGVKRHNNLFDGISQTDNMSLVMADLADETAQNRYITVQIGHDARAAVNVVDNPELVGRIIKVQGLLLNDNANPLYLGLPGVRNVNTHSQYERPAKDQTSIDTVFPLQVDRPMYDLLGRPVGNGYRGVVLQDGHKYLIY